MSKKKKKESKLKSIKDIKQALLESDFGYDSESVFRLADNELQKTEGRKEFKPDTNYYKALTLLEFDKGLLLLNSLPKLHEVFGLEFYKNLSREFNCTSSNEKALAEVVTLNFARILEIQRRIKNKLDNMKTRYDIQYLAVLSKELDRAQRHYLTSLQALKLLREPSYKVNLKANTAIVGQNQAVQLNNS